MWTHILLIAAFILNDGAMGLSIEVREAGCTVEGVNYATGHTMCLPDATNMEAMPLSVQEQQDIVDAHNDLRSNVKPKASDMLKIYWDDKIAAVAQKWAQTCPPVTAAHDGNREIPGYGINIGQNGAFGTLDCTVALDLWYNEVNDYNRKGSNEFYVVGHFLQVVAGHTVAIGCGVTHCEDHQYKDICFCNYAFGQEASPPDYNNPYVTNNKKNCTRTCPDHCNNALCDCGKLMCLNGGTLNYADCTCNCPSLYDDGGSCATKTCPEAPESCNWNSDQCIYQNVKEDCPYMCGLCP